MEFTVRQLSPDDVDAIAGTFAPRNKRREQYVRYLAEQQAGERVTLVAVSGGRVIGYTNVLWRSGYARFRTEIWRRWPMAGTPHVFASRAEYDALVEAGQVLAQ